jgi:hypothetical protein
VMIKEGNSKTKNNIIFCRLAIPYDGELGPIAARTSVL